MSAEHMSKLDERTRNALDELQGLIKSPFGSSWPKP